MFIVFGLPCRRNIIKSACQIIDRGVNLYSPWSGNYNFWPTIKGNMIAIFLPFRFCLNELITIPAFIDEFEKVYFKIDHVKKMKEPELENVLRQFMGDNLMEPLKDAYLVNRHVTNVDHHCDEIAICLFNEIYRDRTSINTMVVGGVSRALISRYGSSSRFEFVFKPDFINFHHILTHNHIYQICPEPQSN